MTQINFSKEDFEDLKKSIDEVLEGKYNGLNFRDPSTEQAIVFHLVEDTSQEKENLALVEKAQAAGVSQAEIKFIRILSEASGKSFSFLMQEFIEFHLNYTPDAK